MTVAAASPFSITPGILSPVEQIGEAIARAEAAGLIEMTRPGTPTARNQRYRLTEAGRRTCGPLASSAANLYGTV